MTTRLLDLRDEIEAFEMPEIKQFTQVIWYPSGRKDSNGEIAVVEKMYPETAELLIFGRNGLRVSSRYYKDPRLKMPAYADGGCFDFPEDSTAGRLADLEKRVADLERQAATAKPTRSTGGKAKSAAQQT